MSAPIEVDADAIKVIRLVSACCLSLSSEKAAQADLEVLLLEHEFHFTREHRLSASDVPDFFLRPSGLAIEVKLRGAQKMEVFRQLERYAEHAEVSSVLLVTNMTMGLPASIGGKPAYYASLGRAWL